LRRRQLFATLPACIAQGHYAAKRKVAEYQSRRFARLLASSLAGRGGNAGRDEGMSG